MSPLIRMHAADNVATALRDLSAGEVVTFAQESGPPAPLRLRQAIPFGHKVALRDLASGAEIMKYGACIGLASAPIAAGEHVHVHNVISRRGRAQVPPT